MDEDISIGEEIAAEIQLSVSDDAQELEDQLSNLNKILEKLRDAELTTNVVSDDAPNSFSVCAIVSDHASRPAFSGLLYGVAALSMQIDIEGTNITDISQDARSVVETCDFGDAHRRMRWEERELMMKLGESAIEEGVDLVLLDSSLTIPRQDMLTYEDSVAKKQWDEMLSQLNEFWEIHHQRLRPWADTGPFIAGLSRTRGNLLFTALREANPDQFIEPIGNDLIDIVTKSWDEIRSIGPNRLISRAIRSNERTIAYPFSVSRLDRRWRPAKLQDLDVQGFFHKANSENDTIHIELPGSADVYSLTDLTEFAQYFSSLFWLSKIEIPVPIWYATENCEFPSEMLDLYYKELVNHSEDVNNE
jgi:hypothetical protein